MVWLTTQQVANELGKSIRTIERWRENGFLVPKFRTSGNHSRYSKEQLEPLKIRQEFEEMML